MTHLRIEQNNGITEQVSPSVIEKLYEIVHSGNLDSSSNLMGSLNTTGTYQNYVDYLEEQFIKNGVRQLIITANKLYISFADPVVRDYWANSSYGDGTGIDSVTIKNITSFPNNSSFENNKQVISFDELDQFIGITEIRFKFFYNSTIQSIGLNNIRSLKGEVFRNSDLSGQINIPNLSSLDGNYIFLGTKITSAALGSNVQQEFKINRIPISTFSDCSLLESVTGLSEVNTIDQYAFYQCPKLHSLDLSNNLTTIGNNAFQGDTDLKCIDLSSVTSINQYAFRYCSKLIDLNTNDETQINTGQSTCTLNNLSSITYGTFEGTALTNKTININNVLSIGINAFSASGISNINAESCTFVDTYAFSGCSNLTKVVLGDVTQIGSAAFKNCTNLREVIFGSANYNSSTGYVEISADDLTSIGSDAFRSCSNLFVNNMTVGQNSGPVHLILNNLTSLGWLGIGGKMSALTLTSLQVIPSDFMTGNENLRYVSIPSATQIGGNAFKNCVNLSQIILSNNITSIGGSAFQNCSLLTGPFTIPATVTDIGSQVFVGCTGITCTIMEGLVPPTISWGVSVKYDTPIYVPDEALSAYQAAWDGIENNRAKNALQPMSNYNPS